MNWFKNIFDKPLDPIAFDFLICDIHSHLIPGIDDGSPNLETSIKIINNLKELGFKKMITTPHIMSDYYRNTPEIILDGLAKLKKGSPDRRLYYQREFEMGVPDFTSFKILKSVIKYSDKLLSEYLSF